jgi:hypothetical protein
MEDIVTLDGDNEIDLRSQPRVDDSEYRMTDALQISDIDHDANICEKVKMYHISHLTSHIGTLMISHIYKTNDHLTGDTCTSQTPSNRHGNCYRHVPRRRQSWPHNILQNFFETYPGLQISRKHQIRQTTTHVVPLLPFIPPNSYLFSHQSECATGFGLFTRVYRR